jgi:hypothetical protein
LRLDSYLFACANGAADKPRKARKPQAFSPEVGLIRVVVRRFAPSNHADAYPPPRCREREASATTSDYAVCSCKFSSDAFVRQPQLVALTPSELTTGSDHPNLSLENLQEVQFLLICHDPPSLIKSNCFLKHFSAA